MKPISPLIQYFIGAAALSFALVGLWSGLASLPWPEMSGQSRLTATNPFSSVSIEAHAAFVYEPDTGRVLYAKNEYERLPIASLTKVMAALTASELLPDSTIVPFSRRHYRLNDLVALTLISSSNQGALALATATQAGAERDLVEAMNTEARILNLSQTAFANSTGLDLDGNRAGSYSSAYDVARLLTHVLSVRPELLSATKFEEIEVPTIEGLRHRFQNTNEIVKELPGLLGSKTGFTDIAAGSLAIAFDRGLNQPIVAVVLGSTEAGRFTDMERLVAAALETFLLPS